MLLKGLQLCVGGNVLVDNLKHVKMIDLLGLIKNLLRLIKD